MRRSIALVLAPIALLASACSGASGSGGSSGVEVVASFYPLAFVAEEVGGDLVDVENLTPPGAEPHDLELSPGQARALVEADLVLYLGNDFQPSVEDAVEDLDEDVVDVLVTQDELLEDEEHAEEESGEFEEPPFDPHVWLDPRRTATIARLVSDHLAKVDADNAETYEDNAEDLVARLDALDEEFRDTLATCKRNELVTAHEAFGYLAQAYGLEQIGIAGLDPEAEPSPQQLAEVSDFVGSHDITTIYFEVLVSPDVAETVAEEAGADTARLDPLEGPPEDGDYFTAMRANLEALSAGLGCE